MTDRERAIVMAYTGVVMLVGEKLKLFYKYCEELMGRPVYTHELGGTVAEQIRERAKSDFIKLCHEGMNCGNCANYRGHIEGFNRMFMANCDVRGEIPDMPEDSCCPNWKERIGE